MRQIWIIAKRDFRSYFSTPVAYVLVGLFLGIMSWIFLGSLARLQANSMRVYGGGANETLTAGVLLPVFGNMNVILLLLLPGVTMRLFAEERKLQTIQLLMTAPLTVWEMILGKFLAAMMMLLVMLASTSVLMAVLIAFGNPDYGPLLSCYLGTLLVSSCTIALGVLFSASTENQLIAMAGPVVVALFFWLISFAAQSAGPAAAETYNYLSLINHFQNFGQGQLSSVDFIYYGSFIYFTLFLTHRILESYRWR